MTPGFPARTAMEVGVSTSIMLYFFHFHFEWFAAALLAFYLLLWWKKLSQSSIWGENRVTLFFIKSCTCDYMSHSVSPLVRRSVDPSIGPSSGAKTQRKAIFKTSVTANPYTTDTVANKAFFMYKSSILCYKTPK